VYRRSTKASFLSQTLEVWHIDGDVRPDGEHAAKVAFLRLYDQEAGTLVGFFARRTFDAEIAAELTAETWAEAYSAWPRFRDRGAGAAQWLYRIARRQLGRYYRTGRIQERARRRLRLPERVVGAGDLERIEELIDFERLGRAVAGALTQLSVGEREAITLRVVEERDYPDVAERLRCTEEAARARVSRALRRLAVVMEHEAEGGLG
jgi:RNA polymerase sigma factor (sigma-70 family)